MFKVKNKDTSTSSGGFAVKFKHISHLVPPTVSIANFEHVIAGWITLFSTYKNFPKN